MKTQFSQGKEGPEAQTAKMVAEFGERIHMKLTCLLYESYRHIVKGRIAYLMSPIPDDRILMKLPPVLIGKFLDAERKYVDLFALTITSDAVKAGQEAYQLYLEVLAALPTLVPHPVLGLEPVS